MRTRIGDGVVSLSLSLENTSSRVSMNIEREVSRERRSAFLNAFKPLLVSSIECVSKLLMRVKERKVVDRFLLKKKKSRRD